jgi:hypothetical protein
MAAHIFGHFPAKNTMYIQYIYTVLANPKHSVQTTNAGPYAGTLLPNCSPLIVCRPPLWCSFFLSKQALNMHDTQHTYAQHMQSLMVLLLPVKYHSSTCTTHNTQTHDTRRLVWCFSPCQNYQIKTHNIQHANTQHTKACMMLLPLSKISAQTHETNNTHRPVWCPAPWLPPPWLRTAPSLWRSAPLSPLRRVPTSVWW